MLNLFLASGDWAGSVFPVVRLVILGLLVVISLVLIVVVLFQPSSTQGLGAISGGTDTFFAKNKSKTLEGTMRRITIFCSIAIVVLSVVFFVLYLGVWY